MNVQTKISAQDQRRILEAYSAGTMGTRDAIEALCYRDFADIIIGLAEAGLDLPPPADSPHIQKHKELAEELLLPLLRKDA